MEVCGDSIGKLSAATGWRLSRGQDLLLASAGPSAQPGCPIAQLRQGFRSTEDPPGGTRRTDLRGGPERVAPTAAVRPPADHPSAPPPPSATSGLVSEPRRLPRLGRVVAHRLQCVPA